MSPSPRLWRMRCAEVAAAGGASVVVAGTAAGASDARIPGLERDEAARLRDRLAALGEAKAAGL